MSAVPAPESGPDAGAVWHYGDPLGEQRAAATEAVIVDRGHRATIELTGDDRQSWLHTISSQHVSSLPEGSVVQNLSLDGQGRVEDHWLQTELGGVTTLDTESWRGQPLADFLRKMVFWADVSIEPAGLAVLSLLGPGLAEPAVLAALGVAGAQPRCRVRPPVQRLLQRAGDVRRVGGVQQVGRHDDQAAVGVVAAQCGELHR